MQTNKWISKWPSTYVCFESLCIRHVHYLVGAAGVPLINGDESAMSWVLCVEIARRVGLFKDDVISSSSGEDEGGNIKDS